MGYLVSIDVSWTTAKLCPEWTTIMTVPVGYRPTVGTVRTRDAFAATAPYLFEVTTAGAIRVGAASVPANKNCSIHVAYIAAP